MQTTREGNDGKQCFEVQNLNRNTGKNGKYEMELWESYFTSMTREVVLARISLRERERPISLREGDPSLSERETHISLVAVCCFQHSLMVEEMGEKCSMKQ